MFRRWNRRVFVPVLAVLLTGAATAVYQAVRTFAQVGGDSIKAPIEEPLASTSSVAESSTSSDEDNLNWRRRVDLDWKWLQGRQLTEAETTELLHSYRKLRPGVRNHLTDSDKQVIAQLDKVQQMPPTDYPDFLSIPEGDKKWSEARYMHGMAQWHFANSSGFGFFRMFYTKNERGASTAHAAIDRVELVSLLTSNKPNAYVIDDMATPRIAKVAKRRPLDVFESAALEAVKKGEDLIYSPVVPTRMFGALRADGICIRCHDDKREGDLLGAFTYWLKRPVDKIEPSP